jgi:hypothetical protein
LSGGRAVETGQPVAIVPKDVALQPADLGATGYQHQGVPAYQLGEQRAQCVGLRRWLDPVQVIEDEQVTLAAQTPHQPGPFGGGAAQRLDLGDVFKLVGQLPGHGVDQLLDRPRLGQKIEREHLLNKAGALPPLGQMVQEGGLAAPGHAAQKQQVAARIALV